MHGHNYKVEVCVAGHKLDGSGFLVDFGTIKSALNALVGAIDHTYLNDTIPKPFQPPSAENIAFYIYSALKEKLSVGGDVSVKVWETPHQWAEYGA